MSKFLATRTAPGTPQDLSPSPVTLTGLSARATGPNTREGSVVLSGTGTQLTAPKFQFNWWTGGFTFEAWVLYKDFTNTVGQIPAVNSFGNMQTAGATNSWSIGPTTTGQLTFYYYSAGPNTFTSSSSMTAGVWTHICAQHDGTNLYLYINGVSVAGPQAVSGLATITNNYFSIGQYAGPTYPGPNFQTGDVRIVTGATVYPVSGFTPPSAPLGLAISGTTVFLLQVSLIYGMAFMSKTGAGQARMWKNS
jgi:hypothetical protein